MKHHTVCGSYPGATPWDYYSNDPPEKIARDLIATATDCDGYTVDGVFYPA